MEVIGSQIVVFVILVLLGFYVFRTYRFKPTTYELIICALMITISMVLQLISVTIPLFGFPTLKVGFSQLPLMLLGFLLNPAYAFVVGIIKDVIGLILDPTGFPFLGFTLNTVLVGVIPGLWYHAFKDKQNEQLQYYAMGAVSMLLLAAAVLVWNPNWIGIDALKISQEIKWILSLLLAVIFVLVISFLSKRKDPLFAIYTIAVLSVLLIVNFISTPIYLNIMYGMPIVLSVTVRIFKEGMLFPITVVTGYLVLRVLLRVYRKS